MSTQTDLSDTIKGLLQTIPSIRQVYGITELPVAPNAFPCALLILGPSKYHQGHLGGTLTTIRVLMLFSKQDSPTALNQIPPYIGEEGDESISQVLETGTGNRIHCESNSGVGYTSWGGAIYISTEFEVSTLA